ncbi:MAG: ShlB/FhaC/HecB family hemolysin secretion/activation protein, partial [Cyanobacteria bacterium HKST-UBA03]|nr:ShlB/FhaC/HecB family hemolysin secretion/activation protein [Cyanobacteria bacterium HKST-UBA03]
LNASSANAQLNIQSNPVFSTPIPEEQQLGPQPEKFKGQVTVEKKADPSEPSKDFTMDSIEFEGNQYYNDWTVKRYLKPLTEKKGDTLTLDELQAVINEINSTSQFKVNATLEDGDKDGETKVHLDVYEKQPFQVSLTTDNQGRPGMGFYRGGANVSTDSLLGFGDKLTVNYVGASRSHRFAVNYAFPVNRRGGNFNFLYAHQDIHYDPSLTLRGLPQFGRDNVWIPGFTQPLDKKKEWTLYTNMLFRQVTINRGGRRIVAADPRPWTVGLKFDKPDGWGRTIVDAASIQNFRWFGTDTQYWRGKLVVKRIFVLPHKQKIVLRAMGQYTPDALPPVQQFPIGGTYTVRGYTEGLITNDRGYFLSAEYYTPVPFLNRVSPWLADRTQLVGFYDFGQAWLDTSNARFVPGVSSQPTRTLLTSAGGGVRYRLTPYLQGFCDAGFGLLNRNNIELVSQPTARIHFGIRSTLLRQKFKKRDSGDFESL